MEILVIVVGILIAVAGIVMSMLPALPGPVVSFCSLLLLYLSLAREVVPPKALAIFGVITLIILIVENFVPVAAASFAGASKRAVRGSLFGTLIGLLLFPPFGAIAGAILGAIAGELSDSGDMAQAVRSSAGAFLGTFTALVIRTVFSFSVLIYIIVRVATVSWL